MGRLRGGGTLAPPTATTTTCASGRRAHDGVEAFVEPRTAVTATTVLLVDADGGWTRSRVAGPPGRPQARALAAMPVYDVQIVGYPQRMRDHDARQRILRDRGDAGRDLGA